MNGSVCENNNRGSDALLGRAWHALSMLSKTAGTSKYTTPSSPNVEVSGTSTLRGHATVKKGRIGRCESAHREKSIVGSDEYL